MTSVTAPTRSRHVGRVSVPQHVPPQAVPRPRRVRGSRGDLGRTQFVVTEVAAVAVGLGVLSGAPVAIGIVGGLALALLLTGWGRSGGRWLYQAIAARMALRHRRAAADDARRTDGPAVPGFQVYNHDDRGNSLGIGQDANGWFAALSLGGDDDLISGERLSIRLDRLTRLIEEGTARPSSVQFVSFRLPAPTAVLAAQSPCVASYRELQASIGGAEAQAAGVELAAHLTWVAVRLNAGDAIEATAERGGGLEGVGKTLAAAIGRISKILSSSGMAYRVLDGDALLDALELTCGFDPTVAPDANTAEQWRGWRSEALEQTSYEVLRWPATLDTTGIGQLMSAPADRLVVSVALRQATTAVRIGTIVRVMAAPSRMESTCHAVTAHAESLGFRLRPLHGLQGPAVYASAPTGGQAL